MDNFRGQETGAGGAVPLLFCVPGKSRLGVSGVTELLTLSMETVLLIQDIFPKYSFTFRGQPKII